MNFSVTSTQAKDLLEFDSYIAAQAEEIAPEPKPLKLQGILRKNPSPAKMPPQHRAKYHDKSRVRFLDVRGWVLQRTGLKSSKEVKYYLKLLGVKCSLRLTVSWIYINLHLVEKIVALIGNFPSFKLGDRVNLIDYPARLAYLESWSPFAITEIVNGEARLELLSFPVPLNQLQLAN